MNAEKKLIIGLGDLFKSSSELDGMAAPVANSSYAAVRICSSQNQFVPTDGLFLWQPYCVDLRRTLLKQLLPFLDNEPAQKKKIPFADFKVSRRYARVLFSQHQDWVWSCVASSLRDNAIEPDSVVMLIDMVDSFANAVWVDCLFGLKQQYPNCHFYPVFFLPKMDDLSVEQAAVIGAAVTELSQLSQGKWTPSDIRTGNAYTNDAPLWDIAYLQQYPEAQSNTVTLQLIDALLKLSNVEHNDYGTLRQSLSQEGHKIFQGSTAKSMQLLPRFASMLEIALDFDVEALEELLMLKCQAKLLTALSQGKGAEQEQYSLEALNQLGFILTSEQLCLDADSCNMVLGELHSIENEWDQYKRQVLLELEHRKDSWHDKAEFIATNFRSYYDTKFRQKGVEKYYDHSDIRLNKMSKAYIAKIEKHFWQSWQQGQSGLSTLKSVIESLIIHYVQDHHNYLIKQEKSIEQVKTGAAWWESMSGQWQRGDWTERAKIETEVSIEEVANQMSDLFMHRCHYKANVFAERLILGMQPYLLNLQQQLSNAAEAWLSHATQAQKKLNQSLSLQQEKWFHRISDSVQSCYLLKPNQASLQLFVDVIRAKTDAAAIELHQLWTKGLDSNSNFNVLLNFIGQGSWQSHADEISAQTAREVIQTNPDILSKVFELRITALDQKQVQHLGGLTLSNLNQQFETLIRPLGDMLTTQYSINESACLLCEDNIQKNELVAVWLAQCVQQSMPTAKVISFHGERSVQFVYASTCYLDEWVELPEFLNAYRQFKFDEEALLHLHIDGSNDTIEVMQRNSINRNRELIRQHLLLALITGRLVEESSAYVLNISDTNTALRFETNDLVEVVDYIAFEHIQQLVEANEQMRTKKVFTNQSEALLNQLDVVLNHIKEASLPLGVDLEDADWRDAGRYVVWSRAAHYLRKQWLKPSVNGKKQRVA
ncbi:MULTISPECIES: hypothetical protein [Vitreoscilla]|uniref:Uncharacterized protein n=1 Tax=Vitreoscilla stercoraria TaxID=61 RepID=A0ABY4EAJ8_VITST|nr:MULTISPECIES: hypothetical protein [Vitreoscilla]AUZ04312.2 hypothetical protein ADP71_05300 [Vitreoscilla sp. C1]UOO91950.1 hypothetical protein LVJ81_09950 [Vitreoscilla stercoraria]